MQAREMPPTAPERSGSIPRRSCSVEKNTQPKTMAASASSVRRFAQKVAVCWTSMTPETNAEAYKTVSQIWTRDGKMTEAQARGTFAYLQPKGPSEVDFPSTFTNDFLPK